MSDFRPRSNSEILDAAFEIYRRHFLVFIAISVFAAIPTAVSSYVGETGLTLHQTGPVFESAIISFLGIFIAPFTEGSIACAASAAYLGRSVDFDQAVRAALVHPGRLFIAMVAKWILMGFGLLLFLAPGLIVYKRYFAVPMTVLFEDTTVGDAISRSRELSNGNGMRIFSLNGGVLVFTMIIMLTLGQMVNGISHGVVAAVARLLISMVISPFGTIVATLLYYDVRIRREGYDIELMTQALDVTSPVLTPTS